MPKYHDLPDAPPTPTTARNLVDAATALGIPGHVLAGIKGLRRWDDLYPVTDDQLRAALADFNSITMGER